MNFSHMVDLRSGFLVATITAASLVKLFAQQPGLVTDNVICDKRPGQSYALYLPKSYTASATSGLLLFFDPSAEGKFPVTQYQNLAETYNLILACSNVARNGPFESSQEAG